jgi:transposase
VHHGHGPERLYRKAALKEAWLQPKKRTVGAMERDEWLRATWRMTVVREITAERLVFVDEMGTNTSLHPLHAWSPRGERPGCSVPRNRGPNTTLLASMTAEGTGSCLAVEGATIGAVFEVYIENVLLPSLRRGQVVVMDDLSTHKGERVRELVRSAGCELLYLPPYSPDFSPIEEAFSKVKGLLRKAGARSREALIEAMDKALEAVTAQDTRGFCSIKLHTTVDE